jgi:hypothetical protein
VIVGSIKPGNITPSIATAFVPAAPGETLAMRPPVTVTTAESTTDEGVTMVTFSSILRGRERCNENGNQAQAGSE